MKGPTIHSFEIHRGRHGSTTHNTPLMQVRFVPSTTVPGVDNPLILWILYLCLGVRGMVDASKMITFDKELHGNR